MRIEKLRTSVFQVTCHAYELSTLVAAARWALEEGDDSLPTEAQAQLKKVLKSYDEERQNLDSLE